MSLFYNKSPLVINPEMAEKIGLNEAIIIQQLHYWIQKSSIEHDGRMWAYNTIDGWKKQFPFFGEKTIKRTFDSLKKSGYIEVKKLAKNKFDKTNYYSINYGLFDEDKMTQSGGSNSPDGEGQNDPIINGTEITTETNSENIGEKSPGKETVYTDTQYRKFIADTTDKSPMKSKVNKYKMDEDAYEYFKSLIARDISPSDITQNYLHHQEENGKYSMNIRDYMLDYESVVGQEADQIDPAIQREIAMTLALQAEGERNREYVRQAEMAQSRRMEL